MGYDVHSGIQGWSPPPQSKIHFFQFPTQKLSHPTTFETFIPLPQRGRFENVPPAQGSQEDKVPESYFLIDYRPNALNDIF